MVEVAKALVRITFYSARVIFPCHCAVYMYEIIILLNIFSSEISSKFHVYPILETGQRVCSNGDAPSTVMPIYGKKKIIIITFSLFKTMNCSNDDTFISCNDRLGKMLHNICIPAVAISLR